MGVRIGEEKIGDERVWIEVTSAGRFTASLGGEEHTADTKAELVERLRKAAKRQRARTPVAVTVLEWTPDRRGSYWDKPERGELTDLLLRGRNARTREWLVSTLSGEKRGIALHKPAFVRRLTEEERAEYATLCRAIVEAEAAYAAWIAARRFDADAWLAGEEEKAEMTDGQEQVGR